MGEAENYYELETYRDDQMARGRELHPQIMAAFARFDEVDGPFNDLVIEHEAEARRGRIAEYENDPSRRADYLIERYQEQALVVGHMVGSIQLGRDRRLRSERTAEFVAAVEELSSRGDEVLAEATARYSGWSSYQRRVREFTAASLQCMRALRDQTTFDRWDVRHFDWTVEGSPARVTHEYNRLVQETRFLR